MPLDPDDQWTYYVHTADRVLVAETYSPHAASALLEYYGAGTRITAGTHAHKDILWVEGLDGSDEPVSTTLRFRIEHSVYTRRDCEFWDDGRHCPNVTDVARVLCPEHLPPGRDEERAREQAAQRRLEDNAAAAEQRAEDDGPHYPDTAGDSWIGT